MHDNDSSTNNGNINPTIWGPSTWESNHFITMKYPIDPSPEDKKIYKAYFTLLGEVLPCDSCQGNFKRHLRKYPLDDNALSTRANLVQWLINMHNEVNKMNGKPVYDSTICLKELLNNKINARNKKPDNEPEFEMPQFDIPPETQSSSGWNWSSIITIILIVIMLVAFFMFFM